jgi:hypothetical protein
MGSGVFLFQIMHIVGDNKRYAGLLGKGRDRFV